MMAENTEPITSEFRSQRAENKKRGRNKIEYDQIPVMPEYDTKIGKQASQFQQIKHRPSLHGMKDGDKIFRSGYYALLYTTETGSHNTNTAQAPK